MDNPLNAGIWINGTYELVDPERFAMIVRDTLGDDAAGYVRDLAALAKGFDKDDCDGECDAVYQVQEDYESQIQDALDELELIDVTQFRKSERERQEKHLNDAMRILRNASR